MRLGRRRVIMNMMKRVIAYLLVFSMLLPISVSKSSAENSKYAQKLAKRKYDVSRTYHAYFGIQQTESWIFRDPWYSDVLGIDGALLKRNGVQYSDMLKFGQDGKFRKSKGKVKDAKINGSGTYSVKVSGLGNTLRKRSGAMLSMVYVTTDIPYRYMNKVDISNVRLYMDNKLVYQTNEVFFPEEYCSESKFIRFDIINTYQRDQGFYPECPFFDTPKNSVQIRFKVKMKA